MVYPKASVHSWNFEAGCAFIAEGLGIQQERCGCCGEVRSAGAVLNPRSSLTRISCGVEMNDGP